MTETCRFPLCSRHAVHDGYCVNHKIYSGVVIVKPRKEIPKRSEKLKGEMKEYKKEAEVFMSKPENRKCKIKSPVCIGKAQHPHHPKGRGKNLRNWKIMIPACDPCNGFVSDNPDWAMERGFIESRLIK